VIDQAEPARDHALLVLFDQAHGLDDLDDEHSSGGALNRVGQKGASSCEASSRLFHALRSAASTGLPAFASSFAMMLPMRAIGRC
jgi:hypothetical protein